MTKEQKIDKIVKDLPIKEMRNKMTDAEWHGWFLEYWNEAINFTYCCTELKVFKKGDKVVVDGCLDAEIILKNEPTYRVKYIDDQDFGDVGVNGLEIKNI